MCPTHAGLHHAGRPPQGSQPTPSLHVAIGERQIEMRGQGAQPSFNLAEPHAVLVYVVRVLTDEKDVIPPPLDEFLIGHCPDRFGNHSQILIVDNSLVGKVSLRYASGVN